MKLAYSKTESHISLSLSLSHTHSQNSKKAQINRLRINLYLFCAPHTATLEAYTCSSDQTKEFSPKVTREISFCKLCVCVCECVYVQSLRNIL